MSYAFFKVLTGSQSFVEALIKLGLFFGLLIFLIVSEKYLEIFSKKVSIVSLKRMKKIFKILIFLPLLIGWIVNDVLDFNIGSFNFAITIIITILSTFLNFQTADIIKKIESSNTKE